MGIRESLLNTITSVGNSDFVRIVTSTGASSKATVANVFKSFESGMGAKSSLTTSDYIRVVGTDNVSYKQLVSDVAKKIIEDYTGSLLGGSSRSVKSALDSLNSNLSDVSFTKIIVNAGAPKSLTLPNNYRGMFFSSASSSALNGEYLVFATGAGNVTLNTVKEATALSISTATNTITLAPSAQSYIVFMNFNGKATE